MPVRIPSPRGLSHGVPGPGRAARARDAATVALLRPGSAGPEVFLMRRAASMAFAASMYVFPGGSVDPRDAELPDEAWVGPSPADWGGRLSADPARARLLVCAAVRETFEECGVLLAGPDSTSVVEDVTGDEWEADRQSLLDRTLSLASLLERRELVLRTDLLRAWAHWITPQAEPKRFDTRFFVAALPVGQKARDPGQESDHAVWVAAAAVQAGLAAGEMRMLPPTVAVTASLAEHADIESVLAGEPQITPIMPKMAERDGDWFVYLPGEPGYDEIADLPEGDEVQALPEGDDRRQLPEADEEHEDGGAQP